MQFFKKSLTIIGILGLHASLMDIHHDTSFRSILEDDSISSASKTHIHFYMGMGVGLWLVARPSICSFHITHFIFISMLHVCLNLIQPSASNLFMCECEHKLDTSSLDTSNMHLVHYSFGG